MNCIEMITPDAAGVFDGKAVTLFADNIAPGDAWGVFLHEAGEHAELESMLGAEKYKQVQAQFGRLLGEQNPDAVRAAERVPGDTPDRHVPSERLAYLIEDFANGTTQTGKVRLLVQRVLAAVRAWAFVKLPGWVTRGMKLTPADVQALAVRAARRWAGSANMQGSDTAKGVLMSRRDGGRVDVPDVLIPYQLGDLGGHADYPAAKAGDIEAAVRVATDLVTPDLVEQIKTRFGADAVVLPVLAEESAGRNKIPLAVAARLEALGGIQFETGVGQATKVARTGLGALDRVFAAPEFTGDVQAGTRYLLLDDTLTQGGTMAALAAHVRQNGGVVAGAMALTGKQYSARLRLDDALLKKLREKHGEIENEFRDVTGYGFEALTQSEAQTLAHFRPPEQVRIRIHDERDARSRRADADADESGIDQAEADDQDQAPPSEGPGRSGSPNPDIRYSRKKRPTPGEAPRSEGLSVSGADKNGSESGDLWAEADADARETPNLWKKLATAVRNGIHEISRNQGLAALTLRQLAEVGQELLPATQTYIDRVNRMLMSRNVKMDEAARLGLEWSKLGTRDNRRVSWLMHASTKAGVDASDTAFRRSEVVVQGGMDRVRQPDMEREAGQVLEAERAAATPENLTLLRARYNAALKQFGGSYGAGLDRRVLDRYRTEMDAMRNAIRRDQARAAAYPELHRQFLGLPEAAQNIYTQARDLYQRRLTETEAALRAQVKQDTAEMNGFQQRQALAALRLDFEQARVQGVYFPLGRSGDYFVRYERPTGEAIQTYRPQNSGQRIHAAVGALLVWSTRENALRSAATRGDLKGRRLEAVPEGDGWVLQDRGTEFVFERFGSAAEAEARAKAMKDARMQDVRQGRLAELSADEQAGVGEFAAGALSILQENGASKELRDAVYQHYLTFLPSLSMRKHFIHRKMTPGYQDAALNVFVRNMLHQAHQIAKLEAGSDLREILDEVAAQARALEGGANPDTGEAADSSLAGNIREELKKRHEWVMNPDNAPWTAWTSAMGFVWYLGASPAAALVNLTQTAVVAYPVLGARFGFGKAAAALKDALLLMDVRGMAREAGKVFSPRETPDLDMALKQAGMSDDEVRAFQDWQALGVHDTTMAHMLAGVGDTDSITSTVGYQRAMTKVAHFFQTAELLNREVTLLAAYRLARADGMAHHQAVQYAAQATWSSHFDYGNHNRARVMQGNTAKVLLMFKSYSQHMLYHLVRSAYRAGKGDKIAQRQLLGTLAMTAALGG
nr:PLxRFG domain-containing protein [Thiolinea sp.]